jgi:hypothetical protein
VYRCLPILLVVSCGSPNVDAPIPTVCPAPWTRPADAEQKLRAELGDVPVQDVDACVAGFMGWSFVAHFHAEPFTPTFEGAAVAPERLEAQEEGLRRQLPAQCGTVEWNAIASGVVTADDNTDTRALFSGAPGEYLFVLDHAG